MKRDCCASCSTTSGILANDPFEISTLKAGARVEVTADEIFDYILRRRDGTEEGNETGKLMGAREGTLMPASVGNRAAHGGRAAAAVTAIGARDAWSPQRPSLRSRPFQEGQIVSSNP
jgi:hypothetical protein